MRAFIAIQCPDKLKDGVMEFQKKIENIGKLKTVERENIHMTLKFLGDVDEDKLDEIIRILDSIAKDDKNRKFKINLFSAGVFPNLDYIKVVWVGVSGGSGEILSLQQQIDEKLAPLKFKKEKDFHPHFTVARVKFLSPQEKKEIRQVLSENSKINFGEFEFESFELMKSELTREGPIYSIVKKFEL
jgi:2'-5' RNA ligase